MKLLMLLSNSFIVDPRVYKEAKALIKKGYNVTVIVWDRKGDYPEEEIIEGIHLIRIHNKGPMKILPHDLFRNPFWWRKAYRKGLELYKKGYKFDVVHCHDLDTLQAGVWLKKKLPVKIVYDAHEIFSYMIEKAMPTFIVNYSSRMEKRLVKSVDYIITVDDGYANYFRNISNIPLAIVRNCKSLIGDYRSPSRKDFTLIYIGVLSHERFFPQLLGTVGKLDNVKLIIGAKKENLYDEIKNYSAQFENITFLGPVPVEEVIPLALECHVVFCMFNPIYRLNKIGSPNKLFEAMVTGRPIIVTKGTHAGDIVETWNCGLAIEYTEEKLLEAIHLLRDNPLLCEKLGKNGLKAATDKYNWSLQEKELFRVYDILLQPS